MAGRYIHDIDPILGSVAGVHLWWRLYDKDEREMVQGRSPMRDGIVAPGELLHATLVVPGLPRAGRYRAKASISLSTMSSPAWSEVASSLRYRVLNGDSKAIFTALGELSSEPDFTFVQALPSALAYSA